MHLIQPFWWDVEKVIQSNPVSCVDIWFIYMQYNPLGGSFAYKEILYTGIRNVSVGEFRISTRFYLFIFSGFCFVSLFFFGDQNHLCSYGTLICHFDFSKDLALAFQLRNKKLLFFEQVHSLPWQAK